MKLLRILLLGVTAGFMVLAAAHGQSSRASSAVSKDSTSKTESHASAQTRWSRSKFFTSDEGRAWYQATGDPISKYLNQAFGPPSAAALEAAKARIQQMHSAETPRTQNPETSPCDVSFGARFNLEPRPNALPQTNAAGDFILNGAGSGEDLIVQTANDFRSMGGSTWDGSESGYYVHRSGSDCSVQFEGGLPEFDGAMGLGDASVAADPVRGAFFMADVRFGGTAGIGLFRASVSSLLNPAICPNGTHSESQATSCWTQTPPVLLDPVPETDYGANFNLAVDQRSSGTGAGDVYLVAGAYTPSQGPDTVFIQACTNTTLKCSPMVVLATLSSLPYVQVRSDGTITVSYLGAPQNTTTPEPVLFVTCKPAGAPNPPVCGQPTTVTTIDNPLPTPTNLEINTLLGINLAFVTTYPKLANRSETGGGFTTFLVYDDCKNPYVPPPPPQGQPTFCLNAEVKMTFSTDNGATWSTPVSVDASGGHHFFPAIATDDSTGTVSLVYYTTEGDPFHHRVRVFLNQIAPGTTTLGPPQSVIKSQVPMDIAADQPYTFSNQDDFRIGVAARGTGVKGQSHVYTSFGLSVVNGTYAGEPLPDKNNHINLFAY